MRNFRNGKYKIISEEINKLLKEREIEKINENKK